MSRKTYQPWPTSELDHLVARWAERHGVDMAKDVSGYTIWRDATSSSVISLDMYFDDAPAEAEVADDVSRETSAVVQRYLVGEKGPEMVPPDYFEQDMPPVPAWCPDPAMCVNCPGRLNSDSDQCTHWPQANEKNEE